MATGIVAWSARDPDRVAFVSPQRTLTLGEVDHLVGALAARLLDGGPNEADRVPWLPVIVDRSLESAVALHAAIRAGVAFAPIESHLPPDLVADMFARLGHPERAVVAQSGYAELLPAGVTPIPVVGHPAASTEPQPVDHDAAGGVFFTSGTTGRPKGVVIPWGSLEGRVERATRDGPLPDVGTWRESLVYPFGFLAAVRPMALPCVGRTLCVADPSAMTVDELLDWLDGRRVDVVNFPPSLTAAVLRSADDRPRLPTVSVFSLGAEASDWALVAPLRKLIGPHVTIRSSYATSEGGSVTRFEIGPDDPIGSGRIPLGRLEPGIEVRLEPVDDEPSITQLLVARPRSLGYLDDPELTARRYVTDGEGVRWWKSGDIVDVDDDGLYHYHGRADELVKIHGVFVAPSRLEAELRTIDGIGAASAIAAQMARGNTLLVAHVQVDDRALTPDRVEQHLRPRLPRHLMPAILVRHDVLPRTDRGKVDRRALQGEPLVRWRVTGPRPPASETERWCLAEVRCIVGLDDIGPDDDLFDIGLDSLGALELCGALADAGFGDLDPSQLVDARTVRRLCARLDRAASPSTSTVVMLNATGSRTPIFALPGGGGTALKFRFLAEALGPDQPMAVVEPRGMHRPGPPDRTVAALAEHACLEMEARLGNDDPCIIVGYSAAGPIAFEAAHRLHTAGRRVHLVLLDSAPMLTVRDVLDETLVGPRSWARVRAASPRELPDALGTWLKWKTMNLILWWIARHPGPPRHNRFRYDAFRRIMGNAARSYRPNPAAFPVALIHADKEELVRRTVRVAPNVSSYVVGGNHHTMLEPPDVTNVAAALTEIVDVACAAAPSR